MAASAVSSNLAFACLAVFGGVCLASTADSEGGNFTSDVAVLVQNVYVDHEHRLPAHEAQRHANVRVRRQAPVDWNKRGYNQQEKRAFLDKHNALRRLAPSSNMNYLVWDNGLEALAQDWAENCVFAHRPDRHDIGRYSYVGENVYAGSGGYDPNDVAQLWYDEVSMYNYNTGSCSGVCGHYTQIVWADSRTVGCGVFYCPILAKVSFKRGFLVVCNYGPGGNYVGLRPYKKGKPATECEDGAIFVINGLCSQYPVIDADDGSASLGVRPDLIVISLVLSVLILNFQFCCYG